MDHATRCWVGKACHWLRTATMPREEFSSPPFVCSHFYSRSQLLKRRRPTLGMFFCLRNVGLPVNSTLPVLVEPVPIFSCAKSGEKGVPSVRGLFRHSRNEHGDKSPCVQGVKPQILKYPHQLQPPITPRIWIHQLLHLCQHVSRVRRSRLSIKKLCASSLSSPKSACNNFKAIMTSVTAQSGRSFNIIYLKEQGLHGLASHESP